MLARVPLPFTLNLDAGTVHCPAGYCAAIPERGSAGVVAPWNRDTGSPLSDFSGPSRACKHALPGSGRLRVLKSGTGQSGSANFNRLSTRPVTCRSGRRNNIFSPSRSLLHNNLTGNGQTGLDRGITERGLASLLAGGSGAPIHPGIEPDRKRPATLQGSVIGSPVRGFVFLRYGFAHAARVTSWIPAVNPSRLFVQQSPLGV